MGNGHSNGVPSSSHARNKALDTAEAFTQLTKPLLTVKHWKCDHILGDNSPVKVYQAMNAEGNRAAIKVISGFDAQALQVLSRECSLRRTIDHPNIVKIYDHFQDGPNYFIIEELCDANLAAIVTGTNQLFFELPNHSLRIRWKAETCSPLCYLFLPTIIGRNASDPQQRNYTQRGPPLQYITSKKRQLQDRAQTRFWYQFSTRKD